MCLYVDIPPVHPATLLFLVSVHAVNTVYVMVDVCVTAIPVRLCHVYQPLLAVLVYAAFTGIYWTAGHHAKINPFLDYTNLPTECVVWWCVMLAITTTVHCLMFAFYRLRIYVYARHATEPQMSHEVEMVTVEQ